MFSVLVGLQILTGMKRTLYSCSILLVQWCALLLTFEMGTMDFRFSSLYQTSKHTFIFIFITTNTYKSFKSGDQSVCSLSYILQKSLFVFFAVVIAVNDLQEEARKSD